MSTVAPLTVMQVTPNLEVGGAQENLRTMARYLPAAGCATVVCTFADGPLRSDIEALDVDVEVLPSRRHSVFALPLFAIEMVQRRRQLVELVHRHHVDVLQTRGLGTLDFLVMTLRRHGVQVWWTIENVRFEVRAEHLGKQRWLLRPKRALHRLLYRVGAHVVNGVIVVSDETARSFCDAVGDVGDRLHVVANAADVERLPEAVDRDAVRAELGFGPGDHVMTMVGTFKRQKGHEYLVAAAAAVAPRDPRVHFLLVGDGELLPDIVRRVAAAGLQDRVHFLGTRRDVPALLAASDSFVLPSLWEGLPVALVEAMASGLPVIATEVSGTRQVMVAERTGWLVPPGDAARLADAMLDLLADPERACTRAGAGRERVVERFAAHHQAEHLARLFRRDARTTTRPTAEPLAYGRVG
jgi:glycosyltransferase involved in cell wall biosynthesis